MHSLKPFFDAIAKIGKIPILTENDKLFELCLKVVGLGQKILNFDAK